MSNDKQAGAAPLGDAQIDAIARKYVGMGGVEDYRAFARDIAALARAPLPARGELTDEQIIAALHANGIDTYPSKYGFDVVQVSATSVPSLRKVIESLAASLAGKDKK